MVKLSCCDGNDDIIIIIIIIVRSGNHSHGIRGFAIIITILSSFSNMCSTVNTVVDNNVMNHIITIILYVIKI